MKRSVVLLVMGLLLVSAAWAESARELGRVAWMRDFDAALTASRTSGKPVFALFQEVPGCSTCIGFGDTVLSDELFVEAIETEFVPLAIFNNKPGRDAEVLKRYNEPAWNNPVVRFLDAEGADLIDRRDRMWTPFEIGPRMISALRAADRPIPKYLDLLVLGTRQRSSARATFSMPCYWRGEVCLGGVDGVLATRAGWLGGREVVEVRFDAVQVRYEDVLEAVADRGCADGVFAHGPKQRAVARTAFGDRVFSADGFARSAKASDQKYYLTQAGVDTSGWTDLQRVHANSALALGKDFKEVLSPRQRARLSGTTLRR